MDLQFEVNFNLQSMAAVAFAALLWDKPSIKKRRKDLFQNDEENEAFDIVFTDIIKSVLQDVQDQGLPATLKVIVNNLVRSMGAKIFKWTIYIRRKLKLDLKYAEEIYWTSIGTIDQVKIFNLLSSDEELMSSQPESVYYFACACAQLTFVENNWEDIKNYIESHNTPFYSVLAWTLKFLNKDFMFEEDKQTLFYYEDLPNAENIFHVAILEGCDMAVKYYWEQLTPTEQQEKFAIYAGFSVDMYHSKRKEAKKCYKDNHIEISRFLFSKMTYAQTELFFKLYGSNFLKMFLSVWPWKEFFIPLMKKFGCFLSAQKFIEVLKDVVNLLRDKNDIDFCSYKNYYFICFEFMWQNIPKTLKQEFFKPENHEKFTDIVKVLYKIFQLPALKIIIMDKDVENHKNQLIEVGKFKFKGFVMEDTFEFLDQFVNDIFSSDNEKKGFKLSLNFLEDLILANKFDIADKLINWQIGTEFNRELFINDEIDTVNVCGEFIRHGKCDLVDKFLKWAFNNQKITKNTKKIYRDKEVIVKVISSYWVQCKPLKATELNSINFLKLISNSKEEADLIRKEELPTYDVIFKIFCKDFNYERIENYFKIKESPWRYKFMMWNSLMEAELKAIDSFLKFCEAPEKKIEALKRELAENFTNDIFLSDEERLTLLEFELLDFLLGWCTQNETEKETFISKIVNAQNFISVFRKIVLRRAENSAKFYNSWLKLHQNKYELKNEILFDVWNEEEFDEERKKRICLYYDEIFEKLDGNGELSLEDVKIELQDDDSDSDSDTDESIDSDDYEELWGA